MSLALGLMRFSVLSFSGVFEVVFRSALLHTAFLLPLPLPLLLLPSFTLLVFDSHASPLAACRSCSFSLSLKVIVSCFDPSQEAVCRAPFFGWQQQFYTKRSCVSIGMVTL